MTKKPMISLAGQCRVFLAAAGAAWAACGGTTGAEGAPLSSADFAALAARCAPSVPEAILAAVARAESGLDPWALHNNTTGVTVKPTGLQAAMGDARTWIAAGNSVDLGLMQINSANLDALGMTVSAALDPCASLAGGAAVLRAAYGAGEINADQQAALLMALSRYNTGSPFKGIKNGYVGKVLGRLAAAPSRPSTASSSEPLADPNALPSWNVWAMAAYTQSHGAPWLVSLLPAGAGTWEDAISSTGHPAIALPAATLGGGARLHSSIQPTIGSP